MFKGIATALITPFTSTGVDYASYEKLIETQISSGIDALVVLGTTGEPATMSAAEKDSVIEFAIRIINKRVPVIIGTGSNSTAQTVENSIKAEKMGADGLLIVTPYYNKCTQEGLFQHYAAVDKEVNIPIIAYNVPGRTGVNINPETAARLSTLQHLSATKEASGNIEQIVETARHLVGKQMTLLSGDDGLFFPMFALGVTGLISVASNAIPRQMADMVHSYLNGNHAEALEDFFKLRPFMEVLFVETSPIPVKYACNKLGLCENILRLPLTPISSTAIAKVDATMKELNL